MLEGDSGTGGLVVVPFGVAANRNGYNKVIDAIRASPLKDNTHHQNRRLRS